MSFATEFYWVILWIAVYAWFTDVNTLLNVSIETPIWFVLFLVRTDFVLLLFGYGTTITISWCGIYCCCLYFDTFSTLSVHVYLAGCNYCMGSIPYDCAVVHRVKFCLHYLALLISDTLLDAISSIGLSVAFISARHLRNCPVMVTEVTCLCLVV